MTRMITSPLVVVFAVALTCCANGSNVSIGIALPTKDEPRWVQDEARFTHALSSTEYSLDILFSQGSRRLRRTEDEQLTVQVSPARSFAPSTVRIQVRIEPSSENRSLVIVADSGEYYRSSLIPLEGADAPATFTLSYRDVPSGHYQVHCVLVDGAGRQRAAARTTLSIISSTL